MTFDNKGTIKASKPFDDAARALITDILGDPCEWFDLKEDSLVFDEFPSGGLATAIDNIVDILAVRGIRLEGRIDYTGSYDGAYFWKLGEHHVEMDQDAVAIHDASTESLIAELRERGYIVQPAQGQSKNAISFRASDISAIIDALEVEARRHAECGEHPAWLAERAEQLDAIKAMLSQLQPYQDAGVEIKADQPSALPQGENGQEYAEPRGMEMT